MCQLSPHIKPIATKPREFSYEDQVFMREAVEKLLNDGVIPSSASPGELRLRLPVVFERQELSLNLLSKLVMSLILENILLSLNIFQRP